MTKISKRLSAIVEFVDKKDSIADVGCDHGLLSIYLYENKLVKDVIASDINESALNSAKQNIKKRNLPIKTILSDGIKELDLTKINTLIISGMGTSTIIHILEDSFKLTKIKKIIIQSNNNHQELRTFLNSIGYYLEEESYTKERNKWYITCKFIKSTQKNDETTINYGFLNNPEYNEYLISSLKKIYKKIPITSIKEKVKFNNKIKNTKKAISTQTK